ncbi:LINE-1 reverse transcriptase-like [Symbiodinium microadriaticum]|uniref:LINE-1 reverse transcriptase-like n=1 Tax=Symbiodinium microadriaticum TaxID=2951 RepID=A0A1Q9DGZ4_SYMMI|nr:LINE-1 reverse transcriptase-like [Symbiodinium microadriaticum]
MSSDGCRSPGLDSGSDVDCTPRDFQRDGPVQPRELAPKGPPIPQPLLSGDNTLSTAVHGPRERDPPIAADDSDRSSAGSRPERRWPLLGEDRVQGPHRPDGRFGSTTSSDTDSDEVLDGLSSDSAAAADHDAASSGAEHDDDHVARDDDTDGGSSTWSSTTLVLAGPSLAQAKGTLLGLYRSQLSATELLTSRQQGGRVGALRKRLRNGDWASVQAAAQHYLAGEQQASWRNFEYRATHERRPRRVVAAAAELVCSPFPGMWKRARPPQQIVPSLASFAACQVISSSTTTLQQAQIPVLPVHWRPGKQQNSAKPIDKARLIQAAADRNQDAEHLQQLVAAKLQDLPLADPHALHDRINAILQASVQQAFPAVAASDNRVSAQEPFRASARFTWQLYRAVRRPRVATAAAILHKWKLCTAFARASAALRHQSRSLKRAAFQSKLAQAEDAATRGDQRTLYQIVRSLGPPSRQHFSRLRNAQGQFLTRGEEAQALVAQGKATYEQLADQPLTAQLYDSLDITDEEITLQLQATKAAKAVPGHLAPAAAWKICASCLGPLLGASLRHHLMQGKAGLLHGDLTDAQMVMLPKAGKSPHLLENLRPIGLMGPPSKALAGALRDRMAAQLQALLRFRPQFAYTAGRGTMNALLRVHMHVAAAARLIRRNQISRCCRHAGQRPLPLGGALSLSLDLSRAFDLADRCCIYATLEKYQVPRSIIDAIQRLHTGSKFVYKAGDRTASFMPTNGLKQGCKIAPCLWVWYTIALFDTLEARLSECWIRTVPTMFADDCWASWLIHSADELRRALKDLQILLCTLEDYKMRINFTKTAVLVKLVGKQASQALCNCTCIRHGVSHLVVVVNGRTQYVPIRTEHEYLGSRVCYDRVADRNLDHRLQAGQLRYHKIQRALTGKHVVSVSHRIRLWAACVFTSTSYSLAAVGLTAQGLHRWETRVLRHLRAIMRKPAHLTHVSNEEIWTQACLQRPGRVILAQLQGLQAQLTARSSCAADITTEQSVRHHVCGLEAHLRQLLEAQNEDSPPRAAATPRFACPHCEDTFLTEHALKIHCGIRHPAPVSEERRPVVQKLNPMEHSIGGLPHCRSCGRKFAKWQNFKHHIESGACEAMGGSSFVHKPPAEVEMKAAVPAPALPPVAHQPPPEQNLPLVERPYFRTSWRNWESLLMNAAIRQELKGQKGLSSGLNPETDIFEYVHFANHTSRQSQASDPPENQPNKRPRPEQTPARQRRQPRGGGRPFGANLRGTDQDTVKTLARIVIRQEDQLAELRGDKGFFLFLREDPEVSVLPALIQISKDWHARQEAGDQALKSPLRTLLLACLIKRLRELMVLMTATPESVKKLQAAEWMNQAEEWTFFKWSHQDKKLVQDPDRGSIAQPALLEKIDYLLTNLRGDVVQKFNSRPRLYEMGDNLPETATFFLSISLRGPIAQQVHEHLVQLIGVSALMLVGASLKREIPRRSPAVQQLAEMVFRFLKPQPPLPGMLETGSSVPTMRRMRETWLSSHQEFQETWIRRLTMDVHLLQQRLDQLEALIQRLLLRLPPTLAASGRNKVMSDSLPSELDTLDD